MKLHINRDGENYYSRNTDEGVEYSFSKYFEDTWNQELEDAHSRDSGDNHRTIQAVKRAVGKKPLEEGESVYFLQGEIIRGDDEYQPINSLCLLSHDGVESMLAHYGIICWGDVEDSLDEYRPGMAS